MDLERLEEMISLTVRNLSECALPAYLKEFPSRKAEIENLMTIASKVLPDHSHYFISVIISINSFSVSDAQEVIEYLLSIIELEKHSEKKIDKMRIFESAEEKMKQAGVSFRKEDYSSTFNNLNTALELILKDKCDIPTTITGINTSNVIDLLIKYKVEPYSHFGEARKRITEIANKVKHQAYVPHKSETILGIKAMEELIAKLRDREIKLTTEIKDKIYKGL